MSGAVDDGHKITVVEFREIVVIPTDDVPGFPMHEMVFQGDGHIVSGGAQVGFLDDARIAYAFHHDMVFLGLLVGNDAHEVMPRSHSNIAPMLSDDEAVAEGLFPRVDDQNAEILNARALFDDERHFIHEGDAALLAEYLTVEWTGNAVHKNVAVDEADGDIVFNNRQSDEMGVFDKNMQNIVVGLAWRYDGKFDQYIPRCRDRPRLDRGKRHELLCLSQHQRASIRVKFPLN